MPPTKRISPKRKKPKKSSASSLLMKSSEFKAKCLDLMDEVRQRRVWVVVTKRGTPVAKLGPVDDTPPSPIGFLRGTVVSDQGLVQPEHGAWAKFKSDPLG